MIRQIVQGSRLPNLQYGQALNVHFKSLLRVPSSPSFLKPVRNYRIQTSFQSQILVKQTSSFAFASFTRGFQTSATSWSAQSTEDKDEPKERRKNEEITAKFINLISESGEKLGVFPLRKILDRMTTDEVLYEVNNEVSPPYCKLFSRKKMYEEKKAKKQKKQTKPVLIKQIRIVTNISDHDLLAKIKNCKKILAKGDVTQFALSAPPNTPPNIGKPLVEELFEKIKAELIEEASITEEFVIKDNKGRCAFRGLKKN